ncbi:hypothetical protein K0M31_013985 [Melipona bicolor]|uniref:Uncharacterized protein n=1 Tax=Melipona bicolor TaxID=60889 RepID=A0AA40KTP8_9HYME|nr:hypothetical protein K0M31_013985 [Melipona bicolor]
MTLAKGRLDLHIKPVRVRFDDNQWHKIIVHRKVQEQSAVKDGKCKVMTSFKGVAFNTAYTSDENRLTFLVTCPVSFFAANNGTIAARFSSIASSQMASPTLQRATTKENRLPYPDTIGHADLREPSVLTSLRAETCNGIGSISLFAVVVPEANRSANGRESNIVSMSRVYTNIHRVLRAIGPIMQLFTR